MVVLHTDLLHEEDVEAVVALVEHGLGGPGTAVDDALVWRLNGERP
jgi:hypothetical protein